MILPVVVAMVALSVPVGGGDLRRLGRLPIRGSGWVAAALLVQLVITLTETAPAVGAALHLASYGLAALFVVVNRRIPGVLLTASGGALNLAAIAANGGVMPATPGALLAAGRDDLAGHFVNSGAVEGARLWWLGDVFAIPAQFPLANVFSVGDVVLVVGIAVLLHRACRPPGPHEPAWAATAQPDPAERSPWPSDQS